MANRTVKVGLTGNSRAYIRSAEEAAQATDRLKDKAERFSKGRYQARIGADTREAESRLADLNRDLSRFSNRTLSPSVELKAAQAQMDARRLGAELARLGSLKASPEVDADIALASAKLAVIREQLRKLEHPPTRLKVDTTDAMFGVSTLVSGIAAIGPAGLAAGAVAAGGLGGLTAITSVAVAGAGAAALAFNGMGDAISAVREHELNPTAESAKKVEEALRGFTVEGRRFAQTGAMMMGQLEKLKQTAQRGLLPGAEEGLRSLTGIMPQVNTLIGRTSEALGQLAREGGAALNDPVWRRFFDYLANEGAGILISLGRAVGNFGKAWAGLSVAFGPVAKDLASGLENLSKRFADWSASLESNRGFQDFIAYVRENGPVMMDMLGQVGNALLGLVQAGMPIGAALLPVIRDLAAAFAAVMSSDAGPVILGVVAALGGLNLALKALNAIKASALVTALSGVATSAKTAQTAVSGVGTASAVAAGGIGTATSSAGKAAGGMSRLGSIASGLGRSLPLVGAAAIVAVAGMDAMGTSTDEATTALMRGGAEAQAMRDELAATDAKTGVTGVTFENLGNSITGAILRMGGFQTTSAEAAAATQKLRAEMGPLGAAQLDADNAQRQLNEAVSTYGRNSPQAIGAARNLANAQAEVTLQQRLGNTTGAEYYRTLARVASEAGPAGDAARRMASGLDMAGLSAMGARFKIDAAGRAVATLPSGKQIVINADANSAKFQIQAVAGNLSGLPKNTPVYIRALTDEAQARLRAIGLEVTRMPDGSFRVVAHTEESRKAVHDLGLLAEGDRFFDVGARTAQGTISVQDLQRLAGVPQTMPVAANTSIANSAVADTQGRAATPQTFTHSANTSPATGSVNSVQDKARQPQSFTSDANTGPADGALRTLYDSWMGRAIRWVVNVVGGRASGGPVGEAAMAEGGPVPRAANGMHVRRSPTRAGGTGRLVGPGSGTSDSIPIRAARDEWVIRARVARQQGANAMMALNAGLADIVPKTISSMPQRVVVPSGVQTGGKSGHTTVNNYITYDISGAQSPQATADAVLQKGRNLANSGLFGGQPDPTRTHMIGN